MDTKTRAAKIVADLQPYVLEWNLQEKEDLKPILIRIITSQLEEAISDALKDREVLYEKDLKMRIDRAVREDRELYRHCMHCRIQAIEETKKKAAGIADDHECLNETESERCGCSALIAERIRAIEA